jgi:hypothetical protein
MDIWFRLLLNEDEPRTVCVSVAGTFLFHAQVELGKLLAIPLLDFKSFTHGATELSLKARLVDLPDSNTESITVVATSAMMPQAQANRLLSPVSTAKSAPQNSTAAIILAAVRLGLDIKDFPNDPDDPIHDRTSSSCGHFGAERTGFNRHHADQFFDSKLELYSEAAPLDFRRYTWAKTDIDDVARAVYNVYNCKIPATIIFVSYDALFTFVSV